MQWLVIGLIIVFFGYTFFQLSQWVGFQRRKNRKQKKRLAYYKKAFANKRERAQRVHDLTQSAMETSKKPVKPSKLTACKVTFCQSNIVTMWDPEKGTLLELAEQQGLKPRFGCRAGRCGTCMTTLNSGKVAYVTTPLADIKKGCCLLCVGIPEEEVEINI